jgi:hypothetical protein
MTQEFQNTMLDGWRERFASEQWDWLYGIERHVDCNDPDIRSELVEILRKIQKVVGQTLDENGAQQVLRYKTSNEVHHDLKMLAEILEIGELEAAISGGPEDDETEWRNLLADVEPKLRDFVDACEVTMGAASLSRKAQAERALGFFGEVEFNHQILRQELYSDAVQVWFDEAVAAIALPAFLAGMHAMQADYKTIEQDAVYGSTGAGGSKSTVHDGLKRFIPLRLERRERMSELTANNRMTPASASKICEKDGLGSAGAIAKQWSRYIVKGQNKV